MIAFRYSAPTLISRTEDVLRRMRWKLFFIRNPTFRTQKERFGFRTTESPPAMPELFQFESDLISMIKNVKFKPANNELNRKIRRDLNEIKQKEKILVKGDKSRRIFLVPKDDYVKEMKDEISTKYKKGDRSMIFEVNREAAKIAEKLDVEDRIDALPENEAFLSFKDHKPSFPMRKEVRLLNPSKSNIGKISKKFLDRINTDLREKTKFNQWKSTNDCLSWFRALEHKSNLRFVKMDIQQFYPEIGQKLLEDSINWARNHTPISTEEEEIILHCRRSFLFFDKQVYVKRSNPKFSVEQGGLDSAEVSELVGLFILFKLSSIIPKEQIGIFRDDMLFVIKATGRGYGRQTELLCQRLHKHFKEWFNLGITWEANVTIVNFLDVTMNLEDGSHRPYRKDDSVPVYIHKDSNHPPHIKKGLTHMIGRRISDLSSSEEIFKLAAPLYNQALKNSGFNEDISYSERNETRNRGRKRTIIYFNPPWSDQIETKIGQNFLKLMDKHFPKSKEIGRYFNRQKVKVSYSNLPNVARQLKGINKAILAPEKILKLKGCSCEGGPDNCIVEGGHCLSDMVCYLGKLKYEQAHPTSGLLREVAKDYFGLTENEFKKRHSGHKTSFNLPAYKTATKLSIAIWKLKEANPPIPYQLNFSIVQLAQSYTKEAKFCFLCAAEKTKIAFADPASTLNRRKEIFNKCPHRRKHLLMNWT